VSVAPARDGRRRPVDRVEVHPQAHQEHRERLGAVPGLDRERRGKARGDVPVQEPIVASDADVGPLTTPGRPDVDRSRQDLLQHLPGKHWVLVERTLPGAPPLA
jgi:hypothetical protein